ncbi:MAG: hypothetical protein U0795_20705 [Pirellulales bacterium]
MVFRFILAALAAWRLSFLMAREDGPGQLCRRLRQVAGRILPAEGLRCVKCVSFWLAIPFTWYVGGGWAQLLVGWLALAGVAALIDELTGAPFTWRELTEDELLRKSPGSDD